MTIQSRATALILAAVCVSLGAAPWPKWRGPHDSGSAPSGDYPVKFGETENVVWKTPLPGIGCSTPIILPEQIVLTCPAEGIDCVLAFDHGGKKLWQTAVGPERAGKHRNGSGSNPSVATDGRRLFAYFKSGNLAGLDLSGNVLWKTNLQQRFAKDTLYWDVGTSPVLTENAVITAVMHSGESYLAAFAKETGELLWKAARNYKTPVEGDHSYATPQVIRHADREAILVWGAERLTAHNAVDGAILWSCSGFNPEKNGNWVSVASAVVAGDVAIVPHGRGTRLTAVRLGGTGDVTETHVAWKREGTGVFVPSPVVHEGNLLLVRDEGKVECLETASGKTLWTEQFPKNRNKYYASPLAAGGKLYAPREDGVVMVAEFASGFKLVAENDMGERIIASPVPLGSNLLFRGEKNLICVGK